MYLKISNKGIVDPLAFILMGASNKRNDSSKIGMFGSGNKFALACLLREKIGVTIFKGLEKITINTKEVKMGEEVYDLIVVGGKETSLTTSMGKDWKVWQAVREFYANALDEGLLVFDYATKIIPEENITAIYLDINEEIEEVIQNKTKYFSQGREVLEETPLGKIYRNEGNGIKVYRKGIRCYDGNENSMFDYDFNDIEINESRMLEYSWDLHGNIWQMLFQANSQQIIRRLMHDLKEGDSYETSSLNSTWVNTNDARKLSDGWKEMLSEKHVVSPAMYEHSEEEEQKKSFIVPAKLHNILEVRLADTEIEVSPPSFKITAGATYKDVTVLSETQNRVCNEAKDFLHEAGFKIPFLTKVVTFINPKTLGRAERESQTILIGLRSIELGVHDTINTIIEEYIHLKHNVTDETRQFQIAVINELINYMKQKSEVII